MHKNSQKAQSRQNGTQATGKKEKKKAIAADGGACYTQSGALRHYPPNGTAKTALSFVYLSYILRISLVVGQQKTAEYGCRYYKLMTSSHVRSAPSAVEGI